MGLVPDKSAANMTIGERIASEMSVRPEDEPESRGWNSLNDITITAAEQGYGNYFVNDYDPDNEKHQWGILLPNEGTGTTLSTEVTPDTVRRGVADAIDMAINEWGWSLSDAIKRYVEDVDAMYADCIFQMMVYGDVIYG